MWLDCEGVLLEIILEHFVRWAWTKKRWPYLIVPCGFIAVFWFVGRYYDLSFRDTFFHSTFLALFGVLLLLGGCLFIKNKLPSVKKRMWLAVPFYFGGIIVLAIPIFRLCPRKPPEGAFVVAVAQFTPVNSAALDNAQTFTHRIIHGLQNRSRAGLPMVIIEVSQEISGINEHERQADALRLCAALRSQPHMVIWGDVRLDGPELFVNPRIT